MQVIWMNNARDPEDDHWLQHTLLPSEPNLYKMNIISGGLLLDACPYAFDASRLSREKLQHMQQHILLHTHLALAGTHFIIDILLLSLL